MLILPDRSYELEIFACLRVSASEDAIFYPQQWQTNTDGLLEFVSEMPCTSIRIPLTESGLRRIFRRFWPCQ